MYLENVNINSHETCKKANHYHNYRKENFEYISQTTYDLFGFEKSR